MAKILAPLANGFPLFPEGIMHDFFTVRERYKHALFAVACIVQVLEHLVTLSYIGVPVTINKDNNAVVHVIGAERVTSQVVKLELSDYWVSMSFITYMLYSQSLYRDHEALFHHERRQSSNVVLVAEFFTFCREVFFGCLFLPFPARTSTVLLHASGNPRRRKEHRN